MGLEELADLEIVAQMLCLRGYLDRVHGKPHQLAIDATQGARLPEVVIGGDDSGGIELAQQSGAAMLDGLELEIDPLATRSHGGRQDRGLLLDAAFEGSSRLLPSARGDYLRKVRTQEYLMERGFEVGEVLEIVQAQLVAHTRRTESPGLSLHRRQTGPRQRDEDAPYGGFRQQRFPVPVRVSTS